MCKGFAWSIWTDIDSDWLQLFIQFCHMAIGTCHCMSFLLLRKDCPFNHFRYWKIHIYIGGSFCNNYQMIDCHPRWCRPYNGFMTPAIEPSICTRGMLFRKHYHPCVCLVLCGGTVSTCNATAESMTNTQHHVEDAQGCPFSRCNCIVLFTVRYQQTGGHCWRFINQLENVFTLNYLSQQLWHPSHDV
jgi:hypothetical protein